VTETFIVCLLRVQSLSDGSAKNEASSLTR
jgi:hypothetical protein